MNNIWDFVLVLMYTYAALFFIGYMAGYRRARINEALNWTPWWWADTHRSVVRGKEGVGGEAVD